MASRTQAHTLRLVSQQRAVRRSTVRSSGLMASVYVGVRILAALYAVITSTFSSQTMTQPNRSADEQLRHTS